MTLAALAPTESALESGGYVKGVAVAVVTQNQDPDGLCRVRVRFPWHPDARESYWARLSMPMAGKDRGLVLIPEVDDEVLVAFEREDLRFPVVIGALWNGVDKPHESNSDGRNDKRVFKSRKGHLLHFDDGTRGSVRLALNDGKKVELDDDGIRLDDGKGNSVKIDSTGGAIAIEAVTRLTLKAPMVTIESSGTMEVKSSATLTLRGTLVNIN